jgi:hypothetical protein
MTATELERELVWVAQNNPSRRVVHDILRRLVEKGVRPGSLHYEALVLGECAVDGGVEGVRGVLGEMEEEGVAVGAGVLGAVIKVRWRGCWFECVLMGFAGFEYSS